MNRRAADAIIREKAFGFVASGAQGVKSALGFEVVRSGRFTLDYCEDDRVLRVGVDAGRDALVVELSRAIRWEP
ncbi:MAG TPA: hypothetical protein VF846_18385, partial [Thermoanaerobaculia bacterium]